MYKIQTNIIILLFIMLLTSGSYAQCFSDLICENVKQDNFIFQLDDNLVAFMEAQETY